jgi:phosphoribosylglycinamide formyltransferase-1
MMALVENSHDGKAERSNPSTPLNCRKNAYSVTRIISDNPTASGLLWAQERGLNTVALPDRGSFSSKKEFYSYLLDRVLEVSPTLICLAGFMKVLPPVLIAPLFPKIINIHPSLLPAFPGLNTHERALAANATRHGCSIHVVVPEIDAGPIVAQAAVDIEPNDSPESLSERVLKIEHGIYPWVVSMICCGEILLGERVSFSELARAEASSRGYLLPPA